VKVVVLEEANQQPVHKGVEVETVMANLQLVSRVGVTQGVVLQAGRMSMLKE